MSAEVLFENQTIDGNSNVFVVPSTGREYALVRVYGTFDGCNVQVRADFDDSGIFCNIVDGLYDVEDIKQIYLKPGISIMLVLADAGGSTNINAELI